MKTVRLLFIILLIGILSSCVVSTDSGSDSLSSVSIVSNLATINSTGNVTLQAQCEKVGNPTINYEWELCHTSYEKYCSLSSTTGETISLKGCNSTTNDKTVEICVTATSGGTTKTSYIRITIKGIESSVSSVVIIGPNEVDSSEEVSLLATPTIVGEPSLTYEWEVISGNDYATILGNAETATLQVNNTTCETQQIIVKVSVFDGTNTVEYEKTINAVSVTEVVESKVKSVELTAASSVEANETMIVSSSTSYNGDPELTYTWEVTEGSEYVSIIPMNISCKVEANNTTEEAVTVVLKVCVSDGTNEVTDEVSITVEGVVIEVQDSDSDAGTEQTPSNIENSDSYNSDITVDTSTYANVIYVDLEGGLVSHDNAKWYIISTSAVQPITNVKVKYTEDDNGDSTNLIRINASDFSEKLAVYLSGTKSSGGVKIQSNASDVIAVYLNDAEITSSNYPCVEVTKGSACIVDLSGDNIFTDGRIFATGYGPYYTTDSSLDGTAYDDEDNYVYCASGKVEAEGSDSKGTLYCKGNLTICGDGTLEVEQSYKNCIATKGILTIDEGTYNLTSTGKNGLFSDVGIVINDGNLTYRGTGTLSTSECHKANGIKVDLDTNDSYVTINGGTLNITAVSGKGISANIVNITGGKTTISSTGTTYSSDRQGSSLTSTYYDADGVKYSETVTFAPEGIEGENGITISGGETVVNSNDDGLNVSTTGKTFTMTDGFLYINATKGDGIDSNGNVVISGGKIIVYAPTGSEGSIDCGDSYKTTITGGFIGGISGNVTAPSSVSNAGVVLTSLSVTAGSSVAIGTSTSDICYAFTVPSEFTSSSSSSSSSGSTRPGGGGNSSSGSNFFMCSPNMTGSSYKIYTNCSVSGGTAWNGLYYEMPTLSSSGSTTSVTLSNGIYSSVSGR